MENSLTNDLREVSPGVIQYITNTFNSEEEMKKHYLQMANLIRAAHTHPSTNSEYSRLVKLQAKIKQIHAFLQLLGDHKWEGVADIQKVLGIYMMQNDIDAKVRKQINQSIASQMQFIVFLAENSNLIKQLQGIFHSHVNNLLHLLQMYPEASGAEESMK